MGLLVKSISNPFAHQLSSAKFATCNCLQLGIIHLHPCTKLLEDQGMSHLVRRNKFEVCKPPWHVLDVLGMSSQIKYQINQHDDTINTQIIKQDNKIWIAKENGFHLLTYTKFILPLPCFPHCLAWHCSASKYQPGVSRNEAGSFFSIT